MDLEESRPSDATTTYAEFMIETAEGPQVHTLVLQYLGRAAVLGCIPFVWDVNHSATVSMTCECDRGCASTDRMQQATRSYRHCGFA